MECVAVNDTRRILGGENPNDSVLEEERSVSYLEAFQAVSVDGNPIESARYGNILCQ